MSTSIPQELSVDIREDGPDGTWRCRLLDGKTIVSIPTTESLLALIRLVTAGGPQDPLYQAVLGTVDGARVWQFSVLPAEGKDGLSLTFQAEIPTGDLEAAVQRLGGLVTSSENADHGFAVIGKLVTLSQQRKS